MTLPWPEGLTFDVGTHTYYLHGQRIPGVTSILGELIRVEWGNTDVYVSTITRQIIPAEVIHCAGDMGRAIHRCMDLILRHGVDAVYYPPEIDPAVKALVQWQKDWQPEIIAVEHPICSKRYFYAGTLDIHCYIPKLKSLSTTDVKSGVGALCGPQLSAYNQGLRENTGERKKIMRHKLQLPKKEGETYKFIHYKDDVRDWSYFQSRLFAKQFQDSL